MEKAMDTLLTALKNTPIPTILVVAGIAFLLLSIVGQLAGRVTVPPERQRQATIIGCLLLVIGIVLHVVPPWLISPRPPEVPAPTVPHPAPKVDQPPPTAPTSPSTQLSPSTPQPTTPDFKVKPIPSLNARLTALRFFEGNPCEDSPPEQRAYRQRFAQVLTREIFTELTLEHPKYERRLDFTIQGFYRHKGQTTHKPELETYISADRQKSVYWFDTHTGSFRVCTYPYPRGRWSVGSYTVDVYINGEPVASGSFEVYE
jgi:hypothetical protein